MSKLSSSSLDSRRFKRCRFISPIAVLCSGSNLLERCVEISEGGMLIRTDFHVPMGQKLELTFVLPDGEFVATRGDTVYSFEPQRGEIYVGIRFSANDFHGRESIRKFVEGIAH